MGTRKHAWRAAALAALAGVLALGPLACERAPQHAAAVPAEAPVEAAFIPMGDASTPGGLVEGDDFCEVELTVLYHPEDGACRVVEGPCDVPEGWITLDAENCDGVDHVAVEPGSGADAGGAGPRL